MYCKRVRSTGEKSGSVVVDVGVMKKKLAERDER